MSEKDFKKIILIDDIKYLVQAPSNKLYKKYDVYIVHNDYKLADYKNGKKYLLSFGDLRYQHYQDKFKFYKNLNHNDPKRRESYIKRHSKVGDIKNPNSAAFWSMNYLW
jgi:hypothetical protein